LIIIDYLLLGVVALSAVVGLFRGFVREAMSLAVWVVAIWCSWRLSGMVSAQLLPDFVADPVLKLWATRLLVLIVVLMLGGLVTWMIAYLLDRTGLSGTDRMLGLLFGMARGAVLVGLAVIGLQVTGFDEDPWWVESKLIPLAAPIADSLREVAGDGMDMFETGRSES
jgi:membrane protein required for colicin V production